MMRRERVYLYEPFCDMVTQHTSVHSSGLHEGFSAQSNPFQSAFTKRWFKEQEKGKRLEKKIKNHTGMKTEL